jgi:hypothetical protein
MRRSRAALAATIQRSIDINAPADVVFGILADPRRHPVIDGSGTVKARVKGPDQLTLGSTFRMRMRLGVPYVMTSRVVEFAPNQRIAWRHIGGHVWRYELSTNGVMTHVTETFDPTPARMMLVIRLTRAQARNAPAIEQTLLRLKKLAESTARADASSPRQVSGAGKES